MAPFIEVTDQSGATRFINTAYIVDATYHEKAELLKVTIADEKTAVQIKGAEAITAVSVLRTLT
ncbi:MAG: hypothetical protein K2P78_04515 [Gemmataceae bacterium]|nr:hypothetical protein [Gemmataceae bacterium]